jgi:iron complex outermembrane receptor protein
LPSLGLSLPITDGLELRAKVGRSFNLPTFNDLYWQGASRGNPNLRPEKGWSSEMGVEFQHPFSEELKLSSSLTLFSNLVDNWIQWVPRSRGWSPLNVQQVWARGLEWDAELAYRPAADWDLKLWIHYNLARSTKEAIYEGGNRAELHKQLIYVPRQQAKSSLRLLHGQWEGALSAHFIGQQFTTAANRRSLPAYLLADVSLGRRFVPAAGHKLQLFINVNNIGNTTYMVREGFPMPGRYFELSLNYHFKP